MRNEAGWRPTKFQVTTLGTVTAPGASPQSRHVAELTGAWVYRAIRRHACGRLLDLGCGMAPFYGMYRPHVGAVTCVDWGASAYAADHVDVEHDLNRPLPFPGARFDTILLSDVLEHLPEPAALWHEMARVLAPGGKVIMNTPFLYWQHEMPHDYYRYTESALRRFAERAGLEVVELAPIGGPVDVVADLIAKAFWKRSFGPALAGLARRYARRQPAPASTTAALGFGMVAQKAPDTSAMPSHP